MTSTERTATPSTERACEEVRQERPAVGHEEVEAALADRRARGRRAPIGRPSRPAARSPRRGQADPVALADEVDQLAARPLGPDPPLVDDPDAVAEPLRLLHVVGRVEDRHPLLAEGLDARQDRVPALRIDADGRLVEDEQLRPVEEADGDVQAALHAARELLGPVLRPVGQADDLEELGDPVAQRPAAHAVELAEEDEVLAGGQVRVDRQVLGHVADGGLGRGRARDRSAGRRRRPRRRPGVRRPQIIEIVVVLPAPFGPSRPYVSPGAISKPTPSTASRSPNRFTRPVQLSIGASGVVEAGRSGASGASGASSAPAGGIGAGAAAVIVESSSRPPSRTTPRRAPPGAPRSDDIGGHRPADACCPA